MPELPVRTIRYVLALAEEQNFGRAAQRLGISTATLSIQIAQLEKLIGAPLFERSRRGTTPTDLAREFIEMSRPMLMADRDLQAWLARTIGGAGTLTIGIVAAGISDLGPGLIARLREKRPDLSIRVLSVPFGGVARELLEGESDVVLTPAPYGAGEDGGIRHVTLRSLPRVVVVPEGHPLGERASVHLAELASERFVVPSGVDDATLRWWLVDPRPDGTSPETVEGGPEVEGVLAMVGAGAGVNLASADAAEAYARRGLRFVPVVDAPPAELVVAFYVGRRDPLLHDFVALALEFARSPSR